MDNHQHPIRLHHRLLSWAISAMLATQPLLPAVAATLTPSASGIQIDKAGNGVPVVNIATPNGAGISHNQFKDYNVGKEGLILNNATGQLNQTQLGGLIQNNPHLKAGKEARGIINEVTGGNRSQLQGYTEVAGKAANVMVANPYGITCNGCGFINTPNATLTTGKPVFDANGNLQSFDVKKGSITVEGKGLDASQTDALSIIARATEVNAQIHAKDLKVIAGANRVGTNGSVTPIAGEGATPVVAVDTGALGGMYANRIHLVSSEKGVGVNLGNLNARQGDITLDTNGKLTVRNSLASGSLTAKGESVALTGEHKASGVFTVNAQTDVTVNNAQLASDKDITLGSSGSMQISGSQLTAGNGINISAHNLTLDGTSRGDASRDIRLVANGTGIMQGKLTAGRDLSFGGGKLTNSGTLASERNMQVQGSQITSSGLLQSGGTALLKADQTTITGALSGEKILNVQADTLTTTSGAQLQTDGAMNLAARQTTLNGTQAARGELTVTADRLQHNGKSSAAAATLNGKAIINSGTVVAPALTINGDSLTNSGLLQGSRTLNLVTALLNNQRGGTLSTAGSLTLAIPDLSNAGLITTGGNLNLSGNALTNSGEINAASLTSKVSHFSNQLGGLLLADGSLNLQADSLNNAGLMQGKTIDVDLAALTNGGSINGIDWLSARIAGDLNNGGQLWSQGDLSLEAAGLSNTGKIGAQRLALLADTLINDGLWQGAENLSATGNILTTGANSRTLAGNLLSLNAGQLTTGGTLQGQNAGVISESWRHSGSLLGLDGLKANVGGALNNSGELLSHGDMQINARTLTSGGALLSEGNMLLTGNELDNKGTLQGSNLTLNQASVTNTGTVIGLESLTLEVRQTLAARMLMTAPLMTLVNGGQMLTGGTLSVNGGDITNTGAWQGQSILLAAQSLQNSGAIQSADALQITLAGKLAATAGSKITASGNAVLDALSLTNQGQWLAKNLTLKGGSLSNGGEISGVNGLTVALSEAFTQQQDKTLLTAGKLILEAASVDNRGRIQGAELDVKSGTLTNNGRLQGDNALALKLTGELSNGAAGTILSQKTLTVSTPALINYGILQGGAVSRISGMNTARNDGKILSGGVLTLSSGSLTNNGWLQAAQLVLNATTAINNGTLLAEQQGTLAGNSLTNTGMAQGGNLTVNYQQLTNGGTVLGSSGLNITAGQVNHQAAGKLFSGGNLLLTSTGLDQTGQIVALGNLTLKLTNAFTAKNVLAAGNTLSVSSKGAITNNAVMQGQAVNLAAGGTLINNSQITTGSGASTLSGSQIILADAGTLQAGGDITVNSSGNITVKGFTGTSGSLTLNAVGSLLNTALLYAGNNMYLLANSIKNQRGDILAGNSLWMQRDMAGNANSEVVNTSGSIETQRGDITVKTGHLLNEREGLTISQYDREYPDSIPGSNGELSGWYSGEKRPDFVVDIEEWKHNGDNIVWKSEEKCSGSGAIGSGGCRYIYYYRLKGEDSRRYLLSESVVSVSATGGAARIAAGRDIAINAGKLDNRASHILAERNVTLKGDTLNNLSAEGGRQAIYVNAEYRCEWFYNDCDSSRWQPLVKLNENTWAWTNSRKFGVVPYILGERTTEFTPDGSALRAVIQAGGKVTANFSNNISNTTTTANSGGVSNTITAPSLNTLSNQSIGGGVQKQNLANADKAAVGSPQWSDQLQNALQQINGGSGLDKDGALQDTDFDTKPHQGSGVDTSAYPLPSGNNGYFVTSTDPNSPYLITTNPKLDGLGQLDQSLFGDLYALMGMKPGSAPRETNSTYTDQNKFLGSAYFLDRLNLHPEYDYRFLGDAAFDTRYVSNYVLNQTGSRYINGIGSDLAQMQYLMDNAAGAQQSLGLQFGVSLTAAQIAALDKSILWWEAAKVNGQTVMVPKVYLSPKDVTVNNGSVITGNNVRLAGGNVTNGGSTVKAQNGLSVDSQNSISNLNAGLMSAGGGLQLSALGDISNIGSRIAGKTVALESLDGSISNVTLTERWSAGGNSRSGNMHLSGTDTGPTASITAQDGMSLSAGKDINVKGANVAAGGSLLMQADRNINVTANEITASASQSGFRGKEATGSASTTSRGSTITAGGSLGMQAGNDLTLAASAVNAGSNATLTAGNDLNLSAAQTGKSESHSKDIARTTVSSGGDLTLAAGRDITSQAAGLAAEGDVAMQAGRDVNLLAQGTTAGSSHTAKKKVEINESVRQQGTEIASGGATKIIAGRDVNSEAAQVTASGDIGVGASRDVNLTTATESDYHYREETKTKKGFLSKKTTHTIEEDSATREAGTLLSGDNVTVQAGNNLLVKGSSVVGDNTVALGAGNNVDIVAATNTDSSWRFKEEKKSGLMGTGGIGITVGSSKSTHNLREAGTTQSQSFSTVGSTGGNVVIAAGNQAHIGGADLIAGKDMSLSGSSVIIDPGHDRRTRDETFEQKKSGLTLALSGTVGSAINNAVTSAQDTKEESDGGLKALQATKTVLSGVQAGQAAEAANLTADPNAMGVSLSLTTQKSKSQQHAESDAVAGSTLNAGNNLSITANGKGKDPNSGDIVIAGSQLKTGGDTVLDAKNDILLAGAANTQQTTGKNSSSGGGVGVGIGVGSGGWGISVFANGNSAHGKDKGNGTDWTETTIDSGKTVTIKSGNDTVLNGAQVNGNKIVADVGHDLLMSSQQDTNKYDSKQSSVAAGGSFTFGSMTGSGYIAASQDKMKSRFDSVAGQSGIYAGNGGFDITVGNHTQLDGAVIASTATADKNHLDTGTLGFTDMHNEADFKTRHSGISISGGGSFGDNQFKGNMPGGVVSLAGNSGHAEGTTQSAIADGTITIRDKDNQKQDVATLSRDTEHANDSISPIFDKEKEQKRLQTVQAISDIGGQAADIARTQGEINGLEAAKKELGPLKENATEKERDAYLAALKNTDSYKAEQAKFGTGSDIQRGIQAATAALQGLAGGNLAGALAGASAPELAHLLKSTEGNPAVNAIAHAILGGAVAALQGNSAAAGAIGAGGGELAAHAIASMLYPGVDKLSEEQKQTVSALASISAGMAGGIATGNTAGAATGAGAGKNAVENNYLSSKEARQLDKKMQDCKASGGDCNKVVEKYIDISNKNSKELIEACTGGGIACVSWQEVIQGATNVANDANPHQIRLDEKLKDPSAAALVNYLNGTDLKFLADNITTGDRIMDVVMTPTSWPVAIMGGKAIITNAVNNTKEQLIAVGVGAGLGAGIQYGTTGEVKLSDVIGSVIVGGITAGKGYNPTMAWNAAGGYYQAEISGDDPFMAALLSKVGASAGYAAGNVIKVPFDKKLNPISKQYEWVPTGVWTITKPAPQHPLPSIVGNIGDSAVSGMVQDKLKDGGGK